MCVCLCPTELPAADREKWEAFISGQLADTNKRNTIDLVSGPVRASAPHLSALQVLRGFWCLLKVNTHHIQSASDDEVDFKDSGFHQDSSLQQVRTCHTPTQEQSLSFMPTALIPNQAGQSCPFPAACVSLVRVVKCRTAARLP